MYELKLIIRLDLRKKPTSKAVFGLRKAVRRLLEYGYTNDIEGVEDFCPDKVADYFVDSKLLEDL